MEKKRKRKFKKKMEAVNLRNCHKNEKEEIIRNYNNLKWVAVIES